MDVYLLWNGGFVVYAIRERKKNKIKGSEHEQPNLPLLPLLCLSLHPINSEQSKDRYIQIDRLSHTWHGFGAYQGEKAVEEGAALCLHWGLLGVSRYTHTHTHAYISKQSRHTLLIHPCHHLTLWVSTTTILIYIYRFVPTIVFLGVVSSDPMPKLVQLLTPL